MERYVNVARLPDIPAGAGFAVEVTERRVALFRVNGEIFAIHSACIRCSGDLAAGRLQGREVECAQCGWAYDVVTGTTRGVPALRLDTFEVRTSASMVMIRTDDGMPSMPVTVTGERSLASR